MADDLLTSLGIKLPDLIAGFAGGVVNTFVLGRADPLSVVGSVVTGALAANYLAEPASKYIGTSVGTSAFIVGLGAMAICQGLIEAARAWRPGSRDPKNGGGK